MDNEKDENSDPAVPSGEPPTMTVEELRLFAAERLADQLQIGVDLAGRCESLSAMAKEDKVAPLYAAARLMTANARIADALVAYANAEPRRRLIVERIQTPDPKMLELNSPFRIRTKADELKLWEDFSDRIDESMRARAGEEGATDYVARTIQRVKQKIAEDEERAAGRAA